MTGSGARRARDAATLILLRRRAGAAEVLMGRRAPRQVFMPGVYVFPGGGVDRSDGYARAASELSEPVRRKLCRHCSAHRARAIALAAFRETYEEVGLMIGRPGVRYPRSVPRGWEAFAEAGIGPDLARLSYIARAVTPPGRPRRFNARFFVLEPDRVGPIRGTGELLDIAWRPLDEKLFELPMANVTTRVLRRLQAELTHPEDRDDVPLFTMRAGRYVTLAG